MAAFLGYFLDQWAYKFPYEDDDFVEDDPGYDASLPSNLIKHYVFAFFACILFVLPISWLLNLMPKTPLYGTLTVLISPLILAAATLYRGKDDIIENYKLSMLYKAGTQLGFDNKRIAQLYFSTWSKRKSRYFLSHLWFDIVAYIRSPEDKLRSYRSENPWLEGFVRSSEKDTSNWTFEEAFKNARKEFELNPEEFVRRLERFSKYLMVRDLSDSLIGYVARPVDGRVRMESWITLQNEIDRLMQSADPSDPSAIHVATSTSLKRSLDVVEEVKESMPDFFPATADQIQRCIQRSMVDGQPRKDEIEKSWPEARLRSLEKAFLKVTDQELLFEISRYLSFQSNVCLFIASITGQMSLDYQRAITLLRDIAAKRSQQWAVLYKKIEEQDSEIARQKQIITCLEYRGALENLPNKNYPDVVANGFRATPVWKAAWKLAVETELDNMIRDHIMSRNPGLPNTTPSAPPSRLRPLIQSDFDFWASQRLTRVTQIALGVGTTSTPLLVQQHRPPYEEWSIYQRGLTMYSELSSTIHKYGKSYEINETNWAKSDRLIFEWLKPQVDQSGKVDWDQEWSDRSLPP